MAESPDPNQAWPGMSGGHPGPYNPQGLCLELEMCNSFLQTM